MRERLQKVLANNGCGSRRDCEELIREGRVAVDGKTVTELGLHVDPEREAVKVDGQRLKIAPPRYYLLNKPRGVLCTMAADERGPRAVDYAPKGAGRVYTVGRLDRDSEGLLILTNDGDLCERLTHPRHDMPKTYHVTVRGGVTSEALAKLKRGVWLAEGKARISSAKVLRHSPYATLLEVELREGKNREIRRVMAKVGHKVTALRRVAIGPIRISGIAPGKTRLLSPEEVAVLQEAVGQAERGKAGGPAEARRAPAAGKAPAPRAKRADAVRAPAPKSAPKSAPKAAPRKAPPPFEPIRIVKEGRGGAAPLAPKPRYEPDEDGVIVVRRPAPRLTKDDEE